MPRPPLAPRRLNPINAAGLVFAALVVPLAHAGGEPIDAGQLERARGELRRALKDEPKFVKVHAAEALLELGIGQDVKSVFESERRRHEAESPYRIGIWRVLARTATTP